MEIFTPSEMLASVVFLSLEKSISEKIKVIRGARHCG